MPIDYKRYPKDWKAIRARILQRDGYACNRCRLPNYCVGKREPNGAFTPICGNGPCDAAGEGKSWPSYQPISYEDARMTAEANSDGEDKWIVIVLTIAHLNHDINDNSDSNLAALCQRCHLHYDAEHHARNAQATRDRKRGQLRINLDTQPSDLVARGGGE